jgi:hypothetical protein
VQDVKLHVSKIDNTGVKPNERVQVIDSRFTGVGRVWIQSCDTPIVTRNVFEYPGKELDAQAGINVSYSPLAEVKDNIVRGKFNFGLNLAYGSDVVATGNRVDGSTIGVQGIGLPNFMLKDTVVSGCPTSVRMDTCSGVLEDVIVEGASTAYYQQNSNLLLSNFRSDKLTKDGVGVHHEGTTLGLLNCNFLPAHFKMGTQPAPKEGMPPPVPVTCLQHLVIGVKDAPPGCLVDVRTAGLAADVGDPNVRNSPAPLVKGLTPTPRSLNPLIVKGWTLDAKGKPAPAPEYTVKVLGPAPVEGAARPVLKMLSYRPPENAFRPPADLTPTLEVSLK